MQRITPFLWFDGRAEEAAHFYCSIFKNSKVRVVTRYTDLGPGPKGSVMTVAFDLDGQEFVAMNGGPGYPFTQAVSFAVNCKDQAEVDYYWEKLAAGGEEVHCGWLTDKFGVSWQVVPTMLMEAIADKDPKKVERVMRAMVQMVKQDVKKLKEARDQE